MVPRKLGPAYRCSCSRQGLQASLIHLLLLFAIASGQNETDCNTTDNCTTTTTTTICFTDGCSDNVRRETYLACMEYADFGVTETMCESWQDYTAQSCTRSCSNCSTMAYTIYAQCVFYLGLFMGGYDSISHCSETFNVFIATRCPAATVDIYSGDCETEEAVACNAACGNYYAVEALEVEGCDCWRDRTMSSAPLLCEGDTVNTGEIPGSYGLEYSCDLIPRKCTTAYTGTACSPYRYCPVDVCVVKDVECEYKGDCKSEGICNAANGKCYYTTRDDGENCTDFLDYTWGDTCDSGECVGNEDKCMRYGTDCSTYNPCLEPRLLQTYRGEWSNCDAGSGGCLFDPVEDGIACASAYGGEVDGLCSGGVCLKISPNPCANRVCPDLGMCYGPSTCDNYTGECIAVYLEDGYPCKDFDSSTYGDKCIEGRCVGSPYYEPVFQTLGTGDCIDHVRKATNCDNSDCTAVDGRPIRRYYKNMLEPDECEERCLWDPECVAYSFGYQVCSIYGTQREQHPSGGWYLDLSDAYFDHKVTCYAKTDEITWTFLEILRPYLHTIVLVCFVTVPVLFTYFWFHTMVNQSFRVTLGLEPSKSRLSQAKDSFRPGDIHREGQAIDPDWGDDSDEDRPRLENGSNDRPVLAISEGSPLGGASPKTVAHGDFASEYDQASILRNAMRSPGGSPKKARLSEDALLAAAARDPRGEVEERDHLQLPKQNPS